MVGAVFFETLRRSRNELLYVAAGMAALGLLVVLMVPFLDAVKVVDLLKDLPPVLLRAAGLGSDMALLATPEGFIALGFFGKFLLLFCAYPVVMGLRALSSEEHDGTLEVLLSLPLRRDLLLVEKFAAGVLIMALLLLILGLSLVLAAQLISTPLDTGRVLLLVANLLPIMVFVLAATICLSAFIGRRQLVLGLITGFIAGSFILQTVGDLSDEGVTAALRRLSFFAYYDAPGVVQSGLSAAHVLGFFGVALVLLAAAVWGFTRRDTGV
ncbi:MAG: ABC transporter permease subunit [Anaerolineae bacterium]|nr:ABC transporter permease subunit [Anaerolineae bacterium]